MGSGDGTQPQHRPFLFPGESHTHLVHVLQHAVHGGKGELDGGGAARTLAAHLCRRQGSGERGAACEQILCSTAQQRRARAPQQQHCIGARSPVRTRAPGKCAVEARPRLTMKRMPGEAAIPGRGRCTNAPGQSRRKAQVRSLQPRPPPTEFRCSSHPNAKAYAYAPTNTHPPTPPYRCAWAAAAGGPRRACGPAGPPGQRRWPAA